MKVDLRPGHLLCPLCAKELAEHRWIPWKRSWGQATVWYCDVAPGAPRPAPQSEERAG